MLLASIRFWFNAALELSCCPTSKREASSLQKKLKSDPCCLRVALERIIFGVSRRYHCADDYSGDD